MNTVCLIGRLCADPELKATANGHNVCGFSIAVRRESGDGEADFIDCTAWDRTADFVAKHFAKGGEIALQGSLRKDKYTKRDGTPGYRQYVLVFKTFFTGAPSTTGNRTSISDGYTEDYSPDFAPGERVVF